MQEEDFRKIDTADSTVLHKSMLMRELSYLELKVTHFRKNYLAISLFSFLGALLGFSLGKNEFELLYCRPQTEKDKNEDYGSLDEVKTIILGRRKSIKILKEDGYSDYEIAKVLNTSENQIKKLKNNI